MTRFEVQDDAAFKDIPNSNNAANVIFSNSNGMGRKITFKPIFNNCTNTTINFINKWLYNVLNFVLHLLLIDKFFFVLDMQVLFPSPSET